MVYDPELPGCFDADLTFAARESERDRAFSWLIKLRDREAIWADAEAQIEEYLREQDAAVLHVVEQADKAKRMLGPWLYDAEDAE